MKCFLDLSKLHKYFSVQIKSATLSLVSSGKHYVSILVEKEYEELEHVKKNIGLDLGFKDLCIASDGKKCEKPQIIKKHEKKLVRLQRQLIHKEKNVIITAKQRKR